MLINLSEILSVSGMTRDFEAALESTSISFMGADYAMEAVKPIHLRLSNTGKKSFRLEADTTVVLVGACSRCLTPVKKTYSLEIDKEIDLEPKDTDNLDDYDELSYIKDCNLDVDSMIKDTLYSMIPLQLLCKESCLGLCKVCGANRNTNPCDCPQKMPDPRMAVFDDIFNQFKEV